MQRRLVFLNEWISRSWECSCQCRVQDGIIARVTHERLFGFFPFVSAAHHPTSFPTHAKVAAEFSRPCLSVVGDKHKGFLQQPTSVFILKAETAPRRRHMPTSKKYHMSDLLKLWFISLLDTCGHMGFNENISRIWIPSQWSHWISRKFQFWIFHSVLPHQQWLNQVLVVFCLPVQHKYMTLQQRNTLLWSNTNTRRIEIVKQKKFGPLQQSIVHLKVT